MHVPTGLLAIALAGQACATMPKGQGSIPIETGQRVRITLASRVATGRLQGTIVSISTDTLAVEREEGGGRRLSRSQVEEIEVSISRTVEPVKAAGYGILTAAPLIIPVVVILAFSPYGLAGFQILLVPVAAAGAVGALIGSGPQDVWVEGIWASDSVEVSPDSLAEARG